MNWKQILLIKEPIEDNKVEVISKIAKNVALYLSSKKTKKKGGSVV